MTGRKGERSRERKVEVFAARCMCDVCQRLCVYGLAWARVRQETRCANFSSIYISINLRTDVTASVIERVQPYGIYYIFFFSLSLSFPTHVYSVTQRFLILILFDPPPIRSYRFIDAYPPFNIYKYICCGQRQRLFLSYVNGRVYQLTGD